MPIVKTPVPELALGIYSHYKTGEQYAVYEITTEVVSGRPQASYMRLSDGTRWTRMTHKFFEDVSRMEDNLTGQKLRFEPVR